jgi:hypothetical protein
MTGKGRGRLAQPIKGQPIYPQELRIVAQFYARLGLLAAVAAAATVFGLLTAALAL